MKKYFLLLILSIVFGSHAFSDNTYVIKCKNNLNQTSTATFVFPNSNLYRLDAFELFAKCACSRNWVGSASSSVEASASSTQWQQQASLLKVNIPNQIPLVQLKTACTN